MENFLEYLNTVKQSLESIDNFNNIHFVLGNESCDLDSSISSVVLAYLLHVTLILKNCNCLLPEDTLIIPIQNVPKSNFVYRADNCYVYKQVNVSLDLLVYRDQLDFEDLIKRKNVTTTLVDHHVLSDNDEIFEDTVIQIYDHRPKDPTFKENDSVYVNLKEVGSCSTLIAEEILKYDDVIFSELAFLIYATIVYDTQGLSEASGRAKELDYHIAEALENKYKFPEDRETLFKKLQKAHVDVSHLTPQQILLKDLKWVEDIPVPGLPSLTEDFLKVDKSYEALKEFSEEHNATLVVIIGVNVSDGVITRDVCVYSKTQENKLKDKLVDMLLNSQKYKGYNFEFSIKDIGRKDIICLKQGNIKLSRKQIIPIVKDVVNGE